MEATEQTVKGNFEWDGKGGIVFVPCEKGELKVASLNGRICCYFFGIDPKL